MLHGGFLSSTVWQPNIAALSRDFHVYAPDVIDQPGRSVRACQKMTRANYAEWLVELLDKLRIERVLLVGHSYGGWLALNLALAAPERVERMILLSPAASFAPLVPQFYRRGLLMNLLPTRSLIYSFLQWTCYAPLDKTRADVEQFVMAMMHGKLDHVLPPTVYHDDELCRIGIPTLLLIGDHEVVFNTRRVLERARRLMPHTQTGIIANGGHAFPLEEADATNARVLEFLKRR